MRCRTLDVSPCRTHNSSQAFRFGTGGDVVDTHTTIHSPALHRLSNPPASIHLPKNLVTRLLCSAVHATVACSLTRIRNQRPAGVVRHWETDHPSFTLACRLCVCVCVCVCLPVLVLVRTLITAAARVSSLQPYASWQLTDTRHPRSRLAGRHTSTGDLRLPKSSLLPLIFSVALSHALSRALSLCTHFLAQKGSVAKPPPPSQIFPMQHLHACHGAGSGRSMESLLSQPKT